MTSINHEVFITITKYCRPSDLKQIAILSKECNDIVQPRVDYIFDLKKCLVNWQRKTIQELVKPLEFRLIEEGCRLYYRSIPEDDTPAFSEMEDKYAAAVILSKRRFGIKT